MQAIIQTDASKGLIEQQHLLHTLNEKINICLRNATLFNALNISDATEAEGRLHCEVYLASLLKWPDNHDATYAQLMEQLKVNDYWPLSVLDPNLYEQMYRRVIGISKRCCPVYYHLIMRLTDEEDSPFIIKGFHHTITPCALPTWLPVEIVKAMKETFGCQLRKALGEVYQIYHHSEVMTIWNRVPSSGSQAASLRSNEHGPGQYALDLNDEIPENPVT